MRPQPPSDPHLELVRDLATRTAEVEAANAQQEALRTALDDTQRKLDAAIAQLTEQAAQLGRLEEVTTQRDAIQQQFTALTASVQQLVSDAVRAAVGEATAHQEAAAAQWEQEREGLLKQIEELKKTAGTAEPVAIAPTDLASHFAIVLQSLAEGPEAVSARGYTAALTTLDVEAKGLLQAPKQGEEQPTLITFAAGDVNPEQLSIVRMSFRLLPQIPPAEPPPEA